MHMAYIFVHTPHLDVKTYKICTHTRSTRMRVDRDPVHTLHIVHICHIYTYNAYCAFELYLYICGIFLHMYAIYVRYAIYVGYAKKKCITGSFSSKTIHRHSLLLLQTHSAVAGARASARRGCSAPPQPAPALGADGGGGGEELMRDVRACARHLARAL